MGLISIAKMTNYRFRAKLQRILPQPLLLLYRFLSQTSSTAGFLFRRRTNVSFYQRLLIVKKSYGISHNVICTHSNRQMLEVISTTLSFSSDLEGCIVQAGCYKGGSTAKISIAANMVQRQFIVFDSFEGMPENNEHLGKGEWRGTLEEVKDNLRRFGSIEVCEFFEGWFDDTMPTFERPIVVIYLDVGLSSSNRTCIKYLYPLLVPGGVLFSQVRNLAPVVELYDSDEFWRNEVGCPKPKIEGLGVTSLVKIVKGTDKDNAAPV